MTYNRVTFARRFPSSLDVAFGALDNRAAVPLITSQIRYTQGMAFRDGFPHQPYLVASHQTLQAQEPIVWETNIYQGWLGALNHFRFVASLMEMLREITERELNENP